MAKSDFKVGDVLQKRTLPSSQLTVRYWPSGPDEIYALVETECGQDAIVGKTTLTSLYVLASAPEPSPLDEIVRRIQNYKAEMLDYRQEKAAQDILRIIAEVRDGK